MEEPNYAGLSFKAGSIFTPGSPINERDLFSGRGEQIDQVLDAVSQQGYHAVLYGERGVGKTSLSNVIVDFIRDNTTKFIVPRVNCDVSDTFSSLWRKALRDIVIAKQKSPIGFTQKVISDTENLVDSLPELISPDDIRRALETLSKESVVVIIFDEFDRLNDPGITTLMADTIKMLSDYSVRATILMIGVAESVDGLIYGHQSIERALVQIPMPRMSDVEIKQILKTGLARLGMKIQTDAIEELTSLSQGLPYITHLLGLHSVKVSLAKHSLSISAEHVDLAINRALEQWQQSVKTAYYSASSSPQPGNIYKEVILACALTDVDDLGYFSASAVRAPLRIITGREYDIPNFARHLKELSEKSRGQLLQRVGDARRIRYRFSSPIMKPYVIMRAFADGLMTKKQMRKLGGA